MSSKLAQAPETAGAEHPITIDPGVREWMRAIGFVHESEIEHATSTSPRSRARWRSPRGVMFGCEKWYPLREIQRHLEARADDVVDDEPSRPAIL